MGWLDTEVLLQHKGYSHVFHAILSPWVTKMNVSMWALCKHMQTTFGVQPRYRARAREAFVRTVANESEQAKTDYNRACWFWADRFRETETASAKRNHAHVG